MDKDALFAAAIAGDAHAIAKLEMQADILNGWGDTILHVESSNGNTERVRFILREFAHKNLLAKLNIYKHTALHYAASFGRTEVGEILIDAARHLPVTSFQAFLRQGDKDMDTALHLAVMEGYASIVKLLVEADPSDRHIQNDEGKTPMYIAVKKGYNDIVEIISTTCTAPSLDGPHGSTVVRIKNLDQGKSPGGPLYKILDRYALYVAAIAGDADAIAKLEMQADILNGGEETTYAERVRFILREFAKKNLLAMPVSDKQTALHLAAISGHTEMAEILIDAATHLPPPSDNDNTHDNPVTSFQAFLRQPDEDLNTALHLAAEKGHASIVKLLVEADPTDTHIQNDEGKTPMYIAVKAGYNNIAEIISTTCTTPSWDGPDGSTVVRVKNLDQAKSPGGTLYKIMDKDALYAAAIAGDADAIAALEMQADKLYAYDGTILHNESRDGNTEHVRFILRQFASKNLLVKLDNHKETALTWAAYKGHTEVVEVLIDAARHLPPSSASDNTHDNPVTSFQAFLRLGDKDMDTALHSAVINNKIEIVKLLVEADPSHRHSQNIDGKTPMYIAAEKRYNDIVKVICTTCTAPSLDGPGGSTALHAAMKNLDKAGREDRGDMIRLIIEAVKRANNHLDVSEKAQRLVQLFNKTDEKRCMILELAVEENYLDLVELILAENPAYHLLKMYPDIIGIMPLIYKARDKEYNDMVNLLTEAYKRGVQFVTRPGKFAHMPELISAIGSGKEESVLSMLNRKNYGKDLVTFADNLGWTPLHHAAYHQFDSIIGNIVKAHKKFGHPFVYQDMVSTPFHVAAEKGFTSTVILLMQLLLSSSSAYTAVDKNGQNILHLAALQSKKKMIQGILKYCPEEYKNKLVNERDNNGDTPLHLLISGGCFVSEIFRYEGLDIRVENKIRWTPPDMLYFEDEINDDQVQIKIALDGIETDQTRDIFSRSRLSSKRERKDVILKEQAKLMIHEKYAGMKGDTDAIANCFADAIAGDPISKVALEMKADTLNEEGKTILHIESMNGNTECVRFIVMEFAYKNLLVKLDRSKQTALHLAAHHGHTQVVEVLIDAARHLPSSANDDTHNPVSSFQALIRQATGPMRNTALHLAVLNGNVAIVKLLVEADRNDSHVQNNEGKTPIYIAAENGYKDIVKEICKTCTALSLEGPSGRTTALHAFIGNLQQEDRDVITMIINAAKRWTSAEDPPHENFEALLNRNDESGCTVLELAVHGNHVNAVELILLEIPAYQDGHGSKNHDLMRLIYKAIEEERSNDIVKLLSQTYEAGINPDHKGVLHLILAIKRREKDSILRLLEGNNKHLVRFADDKGWTPLHYAAYQEFDSILNVIIEAQEDIENQLVYEDMRETPFHVAAKYEYTSTVIKLMQLWPASSSAYTSIDENGQNILHLAAVKNKKEMIHGILKYCPKEYRYKILSQPDSNGDTPLHLLIFHGCFISEIFKYKGLDTMAKNKKGLTPRDMLYLQSDIVGDQAQIKIALDDMQTNYQGYWKNFRRSVKKDISESFVLPSRRERKDVLFNEHKNLLMDEQMKNKLQIYREGTNSQIVVSALITTITFTVGFTMPGGLHQSGEVDEGSAILSKKAAFNAFMVLDALALLLSACSMFIYFLASIYEDPYELFSLHATTTVLNMVSVMLMMLIFITGTYVVLSQSPALAITVCVIGSVFFLFVIGHLMKIVCGRRQEKKNKD